MRACFQSLCNRVQVICLTVTVQWVTEASIVSLDAPLFLRWLEDSDMERDWCWGYDRYGKAALSQTKMCTRNVLYMCAEARMCEKGSK